MDLQSVNLSRGNLTEVRFASFFSSGFITAIVPNPPERRLAIRTSVHNTQADSKVVISHHDCGPWHENSSMSER